MASIYFVCHPYKTPHIVKHTICRWNTTRAHWRKLLMSLRSKYIDCNDRKLKEGDILKTNYVSVVYSDRLILKI